MELYANSLVNNPLLWGGYAELGLSIAQTSLVGKAGRTAIKRDIRALKLTGEMRRQKLREELSSQQVALSSQGRTNSQSAAVIAAKTAQMAVDEGRLDEMRVEETMDDLKTDLVTEYVKTVGTGMKAGLRLYKTEKESTVK